MIPKLAIERAIEGGYTGIRSGELLWTEIALSPSFWQALGKALGWNNTPKGTDYPRRDPLCKFCNSTTATGCGQHGTTFVATEFPFYFKVAHHFYNLILTGGDTEKFWEETLK